MAGLFRGTGFLLVAGVVAALSGAASAEAAPVRHVAKAIGRKNALS